MDFLGQTRGPSRTIRPIVSNFLLQKIPFPSLIGGKMFCFRQYQYCEFVNELNKPIRVQDQLELTNYCSGIIHLIHGCISRSKYGPLHHHPTQIGTISTISYSNRFISSSSARHSRSKIIFSNRLFAASLMVEKNSKLLLLSSYYQLTMRWSQSHYRDKLQQNMQLSALFIIFSICFQVQVLVLCYLHISRLIACFLFSFLFLFKTYIPLSLKYKLSKLSKMYQV